MRISYLEDDFLAVETGNNREVESALRDLPSARWIASENRWEVHLSHLPDLIGLFRIKPDRIPEQLMERFQRDWLSTDVRIEIDHSYSRILGAGVPTREIDALSSFDIAERTEDSAYLEGEWDGRRHLYDRRTFQIPTGLIDLVLELLKTKKLRVQVVDKRGPFKAPAAAPAKLIECLPEYDRRLVEAVRKLGRLTAVRERIGGEEALLRALIASVGDSVMLLVPSAQEAEEIGESLGEDVRVYRTIKDLDAPRLIMPVGDAAALFAHLERDRAQFPMPPEDKRKALMIGLRMRREKAIIVPRTGVIDGDLLCRAIMAASSASIRVALTRLPLRGDGRDLLLSAGFGQWRSFYSAREAVKAGEIPSVCLYRAKAPEYRRVERDKPYDVIVRNGLFRNESRMEIINDMIQMEHDAGRRVLVQARNDEFRAALEALAGDRAWVSTALGATSDIFNGRIPPDQLPQVLILAEPVSEPGIAIRLLLAIGEALAAAAPKGQPLAPIRFYDFDDPLPGLRRRNEARFSMYTHFKGWLDEYIPERGKQSSADMIVMPELLPSPPPPEDGEEIRKEAAPQKRGRAPNRKTAKR